MMTSRSLIQDEISPKMALQLAVKSSQDRRALNTLKRNWPETERFLVNISSLLMITVPDEIAGTPLLGTCLSSGICATAAMLRKTPVCPDDLCIIDHFISWSLRPLPRMLCWNFVCKLSGNQWDPLKESMFEWQQQHPLFVMVESDRLFSAEEACVFRSRIREHLVRNSVKSIITKGNCNGHCKNGENDQGGT